MVKKTQTDLTTAPFKLFHLILGLTIWSCHAIVAPAVRLCQGLSAALLGLHSISIDRRRTAGASSNDNAPGCSSRGVLISFILHSSPVNFKHSKIQAHNPELFGSPSRVALIKSIPRILGHGVKRPLGQGEIPNSEFRTPNFKGFTLIELILVMIIIGILAGMVLPRIDFGTTSSAISADGAVNMIASDIRYTQECAMASRVSKSISFVAGQNSYTFPATVPSTSGLDPPGQLPSGVTIGNTLVFTFNSLREPTSSSGGWIVTVSGGTKIVTVTEYTEKVNVI